MDELRLVSDDSLSEWIAHCGRQMLAANLLMENAAGESQQALRAERRRWYDLEAAALRERNRRIFSRERADA